MAHPRPVVLVIDDEAAVLDMLRFVLDEFGYDSLLVDNAADGIRAYTEERADVALVDMGLPETDGLDVLRQLRLLDEGVQAIVMTGSASVDDAVLAMKSGAVDFLSKPLDLSNLKIVLQRALDKKRQSERFKELESRADDGTSSFAGLLGTSQAMQEVFRMVRRVAATSATVLIRGESGTGKELIARAVHSVADEDGRPFHTIDCANIPVNLMETELFGHERGAFTDAKEQKRGLMELADGGTLFLDEIGLMPPDLQSKLLNVFETRTFRRVGGTKELSVSVRFVAATNEDLEDAVRAGRFREDLYYRLNVVPVHLPPLRERDDDALLLGEHYLGLYTNLHELPARRFSRDARALLRSYPWPGNVRELRNVIERAVLMSDGAEIGAGDLAIDRRSSRRVPEPEGTGVEIEDGSLRIQSFPPGGISLEGIEKQLIQEALRHAQGNVTRAAVLLQTSRDVVRYRINKHGLTVR